MQVVEGKICIGSPYIYDIIVIDVDGSLRKCDVSPNADLTRYLSEMNADPEKLRELVQSPDEFTTSITIWTYEDDNIIEKQCEVLGWPNVTHDGMVMFDNTFSTDRNQVIAWAIDDSEAYLRLSRRRVQEARYKFREAKAMVAESIGHLRKLRSNLPASS